MPEVKNAVRMNISLPADLKGEMDTWGDAVNWSQAAATAFRAKVAEHRARSKGATINDVIARLKVADEIKRDEEHTIARVTGKQWAKQVATPKQLRRLADGIDRAELADTVRVWANEHNRGIANHLAELLTGEYFAGGQSEGFWPEALGDDTVVIWSEAFAVGFHHRCPRSVGRGRGESLTRHPTLFSSRGRDIISAAAFVPGNAHARRR